MSAAARILGAFGLRLPVFGASRAGAVPAASAQPDATKSLREDGTWSSSGGSGITQLTGDVTAGPGSGSQAATVVKIGGVAVGGDPLPQYALEAALGGAAALNVGTAPGTVAAGDQAAGGDASGTLAALTVVKARGLRETLGPTTLTMGAVSDGQTLKRVGATVVGAWIAMAYATAPMAEIDAPGAILGTYTTSAGTVA